MSSLVAKIQKNDIVCFYALNKLVHYTPLSNIMKLITQLGSTIFAVIASLVLLTFDKYMGIVLIANLLISQMIIQLLKRIVDRPRPYITLERAIAVNPPKCKYSLPSGHSGSALSIALVLSSFFPTLKVTFLAIALLVGISRIYLGCHYPTDVTIGFSISYITYAAVENFIFI